MQLDRTRVVVRERSQLELLDLALRVVAQNLPALAFALALGVIPCALFNEYFFSQAAVRSPIATGDDARAAVESAGSGLGYAIVLATVVLVEAPIATMFVTLYLGQYMFSPRPSWRRVWTDAIDAAPQLFIIRGLPIAIVALPLALPPNLRGPSVFLFSMPALLLALAAPYANEIILLERNNWRDVFRRWREFHRNTQGLLFQRSLAVGAMIAATTLSLWFGLVILRYALTDRWDPANTSDQMGLAVEGPLALWIAMGLAATTRYLSYIDLRIRREGWELEIAMRAEAQKLEERLA